MKKTGASTPDAYSFTFANKLTNIHVGAQTANNRYWYDLAGNLVTSVVNNITNTYFYNAQNKLARVMQHEFVVLYPEPDGQWWNEVRVWDFRYDSLNRRIIAERSVWIDGAGPCGHVVRIVLHDGNLPVGEVEHDPEQWSTELTRWFVRGAGIAEGTGDMIADIVGTDGGSAKSVFYLSNHHGDTLAAYRGDSTLVAKYRYDAFGNQRSAYCVVNEPENAPRYMFSTKEFLSDAQLYLYAYRVYDPLAGRWTQRDPIDYQDSLNLYQFCGNNPVNCTDADGRFTFGLITLGCTLGGAASGALYTWAKGGSLDDIRVAAFKGALVGAATGFCIETCGLGVAVVGAAVVAGSAEYTQARYLEGRDQLESGICGLGGAAGAAAGVAVGGLAGVVASSSSSGATAALVKEASTSVVGGVASTAIETATVDSTKAMCDSTRRRMDMIRKEVR